MNSDAYKEFLKDNPKFGMLRIRAYTAREAMPISGLNVSVYKYIDNNKVVFFEGVTDSSGTIEEIKLPAPLLNTNNLVKPEKTTYEIDALYLPNNTSYHYEVNIYEDICVLQNINVITNEEFRWQ